MNFSCRRCGKFVFLSSNEGHKQASGNQMIEGPNSSKIGKRTETEMVSDGGHASCCLDRRIVFGRVKAEPAGRALLGNFESCGLVTNAAGNDMLGLSFIDRPSARGPKATGRGTSATYLEFEIDIEIDNSLRITVPPAVNLKRK